jgi:transcription elongation GreA/GreB family factor
MTLVLHFQQENWEALEVLWTEMISAKAPAEPVLELLLVASEKRLMSRCVPLVKEHAKALADAGDARGAAEILGLAILGGGSPGELSVDLYRAAENAYRTETWWPVYSEMAGLNVNSPDMRNAWRAFRKLLAMVEGAVVLHASGWGMGRVTSLNREELEVEVHFVKGRRDKLPLKSAADILEVLEDADLRALFVRDAAALKQLIKDDPIEVLRRLVRRYGGRASLAVLKNGAQQFGLEGPAFNAWWKRARAAAEHSPWIEIQGEASKTQVRLLAAASEPTEGLRKQLRMARSLGKALVRVRELVSSPSSDPALREAALATLEELATDESQPLAERLSAWMLLRDQRKATPAALADKLHDAADLPTPSDPTEPTGLWRFFQRFPLARDQERCLEFLQDLFGDAWLDNAITNIVHAPPGMAKPLVSALIEAGRSADVVRNYGILLARPTRNPHALIALAEAVESGKAKGEDLVGPVQRAQALLHLAVYLHHEAPGDALLGRARAKLSTLLAGGETKAGKNPMLGRLLAKADRQTLRGIKALTARGVDDAIESVITDVIVEHAPELFREGEKPFWDSDAIWTSRAGLARREAELRELKEVKIPANAEAIGKAASYGDLSENSEWESAIEEQRTLTNRAMEMEQEVRKAQLFENAPISTVTVCPGTRVAFKEEGVAQERTIDILGPWDLGGDQVVSYRAPLAAGLLGLKVGEKARVLLPSGEIQVEVVSIERLAIK